MTTENDAALGRITSREPIATSPTGLYVVGGQQRSLRPLQAGTQPWYRYKKGLILHVRLPDRAVRTVLEYVSPVQVCPPDNPAILFKSGTVVGDRLYACTQTEVMVFRLPGFQRLHYVSLPAFNDVHHVRPTPDGTVLVVNTGLDMVMEVTLEGEVVAEWSATETSPWERFSRSQDYRQIASTKPHEAHPNYVFYLGSEVWVTRFEQRDAICLTDRSKRIEIGLERVHDGLVHGDWIYFTTVDGRVAIANRSTLRVEQVIDLNEIPPTREHPGWCRGLHIEGGRLWVGFSRLRPTKLRENISWVVNGFKKFAPARVCCYDLSSRDCVASINVEPYGMNAVFSLHASPPEVGSGSIGSVAGDGIDALPRASGVASVCE